MTDYLKKHLLFVILFCILIFVLLSVVLFNNAKNNIISNDKNIVNNTNNGMFAIMLETEAGSGEYQESKSNTWPGEGYIFNENLSVCENGSELTWNEELGAVNLKTNIADKCYVYFDKEADIIYLTDYIVNSVYVEDGVNGLYYHDGVGTYGNLEALDNSYRYSGSDPDNYVCFGNNEDVCRENNLYRIIGVFDGEVKLIKASFATSDLLGTDGSYSNDNQYAYSSEQCSSDNYANLPINTGVVKVNNIIAAPEPGDGASTYAVWSCSNLNKINLNNNFINNIGEYSNYISIHDWKTSGIGYSNSITFLDVYQQEIVESSSEYSAKIGLLYISDLGYSSLPDYWNNLLYGDYTNLINNNWIFDYPSVFISPVLGTGDQIYNFNNSVGYNFANNPYYIRPVFYLNSNVLYLDGNGSITTPYIIGM